MAVVDTFLLQFFCCSFDTGFFCCCKGRAFPGTPVALPETRHRHILNGHHGQGNTALLPTDEAPLPGGADRRRDVLTASRRTGVAGDVEAALREGEHGGPAEGGAGDPGPGPAPVPRRPAVGLADLRPGQPTAKGCTRIVFIASNQLIKKNQTSLTPTLKLVFEGGGGCG